MRNKIIIENYNPAWKAAFIKLREVLLNKTKEHIIKIEHVGSTSVEGLAAKPIIDIDIIVEDEENIALVIKLLNDLGYIHLGNLGIEGREAFSRINELTPFDNKNTNWMSHHLYVCKDGTSGLMNHLKFRDYLRKNPGKVKEYSHLKKKLAVECKDDIDLYIQKKTPFIHEILRKTDFKLSEINLIQSNNQKVSKDIN